MPMLVEADAGQVVGVVAAAPGLRVDAFAPKDTVTAGVPTPGSVVAWAQVADPSRAGGVRLDPVFLADGRVWTPDQFQATYGDALTLLVVAA